jgi:hypothetical protein
MFWETSLLAVNPESAFFAAKLFCGRHDNMSFCEKSISKTSGLTGNRHQGKRARILPKPSIINEPGKTPDMI